jgi:hypothetical protein
MQSPCHYPYAWSFPVSGTPCRNASPQIAAIAVILRPKYACSVFIFLIVGYFGFDYLMITSGKPDIAGKTPRLKAFFFEAERKCIWHGACLHP